MYLHEVVKGFARSATHYEHHAEVQLQSAGRLAAYMEANTRDLVDGQILEIGCGTGIMSRRLIDIFPDRQIQLTDACDEMVAQCRSRLTSAAVLAPGTEIEQRTVELPANITLSTTDAQCIVAPDQYALIAAAFALQWLNDLDGCLSNLTNSLKMGGKLFFSVPTAGSFPEWKQTCHSAGVNFTANMLPEAPVFRDFAAKSSLRFGLYEETFKVRYRSLFHFLQSLKLLGAGTAVHTNRLTVREMRRLLEFASKQHPDAFPITYKILFGHFTRVESA
jgi:malonyl-CoA O-methyltransferase